MKNKKVFFPSVKHKHFSQLANGKWSMLERSAAGLSGWVQHKRPATLCASIPLSMSRSSHVTAASMLQSYGFEVGLQGHLLARKRCGCRDVIVNVQYRTIPHRCSC